MGQFCPGTIKSLFGSSPCPAPPGYVCFGSGLSRFDNIINLKKIKEDGLGIEERIRVKTRKAIRVELCGAVEAGAGEVGGGTTTAAAVSSNCIVESND
uniref:Uncharacterized protein n=1 Tax=Cannabis sativa TaxID=3483 RepID=A0A803Q2T3_CANSA